MSWQLSLVFLFVVAFAAALVLAIGGMLALRIVDAVTAALRWLFGLSRARP